MSNQAIETGLKHTDGREIFELRHTIMAENNSVPKNKSPKKRAVNNAAEDTDQEPLPLFNDGVVRQKWRILSKVKAWPNTGYYEPQLVDYSSAEDAVMREMVSLIEAKPDLRWDHSYSVRDIAGWIEDAEWEDAGEIEAGVNAWVVADPEFDPKAAIGLRKGIIRSGSVGINAQMVRSHPEMPLQQFLSNQGEIIDNQEVRWIPIRITNVEHMALVPYRLGADPNAGAREPKKPTANIKSSNNITITATETKKQGGRFMTNTRWEQQFSDVCNLLGVDFAVDDEASVAQLTQTVASKILSLKESYKQFVSIQQGLYESEKYLLEDSETGLKSDEIVRRLPSKLKHAENGKKFLDFQKSETLKWFDMAVVKPDGDMTENDKRIRSRISNAFDLDFIEEQLNLYKEVANGRFGPDRSSVVEEIPTHTPPAVQNETNDVDRIFGGK
jgi:hypothetical protein